MVAFKPKAGKLPYTTILFQLFQIISSPVGFTDFSRKNWEVLPELFAVSGLYFVRDLRAPLLFILLQNLSSLMPKECYHVGISAY